MPNRNGDHQGGHAPPQPSTTSQFALIITLLSATLRRIDQMAATLADVAAAVHENTDAAASLEAILQGVADRLEAAIAQNDPNAIQAVVDEVRNTTAGMVAAGLANTPADPNAP